MVRKVLQLYDVRVQANDHEYDTNNLYLCVINYITIMLILTLSLNTRGLRCYKPIRYLYSYLSFRIVSCLHVKDILHLKILRSSASNFVLSLVNLHQYTKNVRLNG